ncbi:Phosphoglycerate dehydrogenase [Geosporobacter subterraneus DSM 17957]|uniref:Phosphoglycerate dehydrogenase n=1 Tax=Geosporobacter subterraneus DSM 17957 TaxID=1121919 RepID=A0A1M6IFK5_9FIRM|nr:phosphoglycerate dehydrogenase [Geosporobacter subterraneus]SHJ33218.1 Phosphoglycerate dehydrogenase [Geosporobacter subterraneus DSM 17957]
MKVLFTYDYGQEKMNRIRQLGYEILYVHENEIEVNKTTEDADVLVCYNPFSRLDLRQMKQLKLIQLSSIGIDQVPLEYIQDSGIILSNNRGGYSIPIGEWIVMKILEMLKNSRGLYLQQQNKLWRIDTNILELYGKTIGFVGTGTIAHEAAKRLQGFDATLLGVNTKGTQTAYFQRCYPIEELDEMLAKCDIVVLTIPYTGGTHHLINQKRIEAMREGVYFINVSRGSIVEQEALIRALERGKIRAAALDVFEEEPLPPENPLWDLGNVMITPHNSWVSEMRNERRFMIIYENLSRFQKGAPLLNVVDLEKGY